MRALPCGCDGSHCCPVEQRLHAVNEVAYQTYQADKTDDNWEAWRVCRREYVRHFERDEEA